MLNAEIFRGCCCKCFILCILNNQVVTSIWVCIAEGSMTVSERDYLSFVSGSGLWEPVLLMLRVILGWSLRGLSGLRKKVAYEVVPWLRYVTTWFVWFFVCITICFSETQVLLRNIIWVLFCHYWCYAPPHIPSYCMYFRAYIFGTHCQT